MTFALTQAASDSLKPCDDLEAEHEGSFRECIEHAQASIAESDGGTLTVHRSLPVEHVNSEACPCRPLHFDGVTPRSIDSIFAEIETADG